MVVSFFVLFFFTDVHLSELAQDTVISEKAAFAKGTYRNLKVQFTSYFLLCEFCGLKSLPTTVDIISLYVEFLSRSVKSVASIQNYVSGIKTLHFLLGLNSLLKSRIGFVSNFCTKVFLDCIHIYHVGLYLSLHRYC